MLLGMNSIAYAEETADERIGEPAEELEEIADIPVGEQAESGLNAMVETDGQEEKESQMEAVVHSEEQTEENIKEESVTSNIQENEIEAGLFRGLEPEASVQAVKRQ